MSAFCWLLALVLTVPALADDVPRGCDFANSSGQEATLSLLSGPGQERGRSPVAGRGGCAAPHAGALRSAGCRGNGSLSPNELQAGVMTPSQRTGDQGV
jgi:hypothetical protein